MNSYKQKKDWETKLDDELIYYHEELASWNYNPEATKRLKQFIRNLIDETEKQAYHKGEWEGYERGERAAYKQAQSEMREDLIKWAEENKFTDKETKGMPQEIEIGWNNALEELISYLNKTK